MDRETQVTRQVISIHLKRYIAFPRSTKLIGYEQVDIGFLSLAADKKRCEFCLFFFNVRVAC